MTTDKIPEGIPVVAAETEAKPTPKPEEAPELTAAEVQAILSGQEVPTPQEEAAPTTQRPTGVGPQRVGENEEDQGLTLKRRRTWY